MITLGIETSCDETALCILETRVENEKIEFRVLGNIVHSQIDLHKEFGGVFPNLAKREHIKNLPILYKKILTDSGVTENQVERIAVTQGPGLEPALWTGITFGQELSKKLDISIIPINHMEGHIVASLVSKISNEFQELKSLEFPSLALLISGGHTEIVRVEGFGKYEIVGSTLDDAVGEAFDKVARMLGLPYPGGPQISKFAEQARNEKLMNSLSLPRPMLKSKDLNFSFSGLKTAVLYTLKKIEKVTDDHKKDISREFEDATTEVLIAKMKSAIDEFQPKSLIIGGGVIANKHIREAFQKLAVEYSLNLFLPIQQLTGDNAIMIALASSISQKLSSLESLKALGNLKLG